MDPISMLAGAAILLLGILLGRITRRPKNNNNCECGHSRAFHYDSKNGCSKSSRFSGSICDCLRFVGPSTAEELLAMTKVITNR